MGKQKWARHLAKPSENLTSAPNVMNAFRVLHAAPNLFKKLPKQKICKQLCSRTPSAFSFILFLLLLRLPLLSFLLFAALCLVSCVRRRPKASAVGSTRRSSEFPLLPLPGTFVCLSVSHSFYPSLSLSLSVFAH